MSTASKREWNSRFSFDEALSCSLNWLIRARQKNVLTQLPPTLYMAYLVDEAPYLGLMKDLSSLFRYSNKDTPDIDRARDHALRLLSVALKAHFFLGKDSLCRHEPYLFSLPDLGNPGSCHYGLVYRLEGQNNQTILVATCDLAQVSTLKPQSFKFPVVLTKNSFKWFDRKHWTHLSQEAEIFDQIMKPWIAKKEQNVIKTWTDPQDFPFGHFIDVPFELKNYAKPTGVRWADALKKWYLPRGFDIEPVKEYIQWLDSEYKDNRSQFELRYWKSSSKSDFSS